MKWFSKYHSENQVLDPSIKQKPLNREIMHTPQEKRETITRVPGLRVFISTNVPLDMNTDNSWYENDSSMRWVIFMSCIMGLHMQDSDEICRNTRFASKRLCSSQTWLATVRIMMHTPAHPLVLFQFIPGIRAILHTPNEPQRESTLVVAHRQIAYSTPRSECENR